MEEHNPYEILKQIREFIEQQKQIDDLDIKHVSVPRKKRRVPVHDADEKLIDQLLSEWFKMYFKGKPIEKPKRDYMVKVFKSLKEVYVYEDWLPYISSLIEWLKLSTKDPMIADLAIFMFGYCWKMNDTSEKKG